MTWFSNTQKNLKVITPVIGLLSIHVLFVNISLAVMAFEHNTRCYLVPSYAFSSLSLI
jgi:hypothetical protein